MKRLSWNIFLQFFKYIMNDELGGLFGGGSDFKINDAQAAGDIAGLRKFGSSAVTGPSAGGQIALDDIDARRSRSLQEAAQAGQAGLASSLSTQGIFGGQGAGAAERGARGAAQREQVGSQQLRSDFAGKRAGVLSSDLQNEQARRDDARNQALQGELGLIGARTSAELGNRGANAQASAQRKQLFAGIGSALGSFGGPLGTAAGGIFGSMLG